MACTDLAQISLSNRFFYFRHNFNIKKPCFKGFQLILQSKEMPELSIIDYLMWALQRDLLQGESRYFEALKSKYESVLNLYEEDEQ